MATHRSLCLFCTSDPPALFSFLLYTFQNLHCYPPPTPIYNSKSNNIPSSSSGGVHGGSISLRSSSNRLVSYCVCNLAIFFFRFTERFENHTSLDSTGGETGGLGIRMGKLGADRGERSRLRGGDLVLQTGSDTPVETYSVGGRRVFLPLASTLSSRFTVTLLLKPTLAIVDLGEYWGCTNNILYGLQVDVTRGSRQAFVLLVRVVSR